jgi:hypothetical protein
MPVNGTLFPKFEATLADGQRLEFMCGEAGGRVVRCPTKIPVSLRSWSKFFDRRPNRNVSKEGTPELD